MRGSGLSEPRLPKIFDGLDFRYMRVPVFPCHMFMDSKEVVVIPKHDVVREFIRDHLRRFIGWPLGDLDYSVGRTDSRSVLDMFKKRARRSNHIVCKLSADLLNCVYSYNVGTHLLRKALAGELTWLEIDTEIAEIEGPCWTIG